MKKVILSTIILFLLSSTSWGENVTISYLTRKNKHWYKKSSNIPYTGNVLGKENGYFLNGKRNGLWVFYSKSKRLQSKGYYEGGLRNGVWEFYYENGKLKSTGKFKLEKLNGVWEFFHENGQLEKRGTFRDNLPEGIWKIFGKNGTLVGSEKYENGKLVE